jgi:hypothetical protein
MAADRSPVPSYCDEHLVKSIPNAAGSALMLGIVVAFTTVLSAPPGRHLAFLAGGLITAVVFAAVVAVVVKLWERRRRDSN